MTEPKQSAPDVAVGDVNLSAEEFRKVIAERDELRSVEDVLISADEDYGPTADTTPADVVRRILAERDELEKRVGALRTLGDVEDEIVRLRRQVDSLQADNTRLVEERRAVDEAYMVEHFHRVLGQPVLDTPQVPADERVRLRLRLIAEEFFELIEASVEGKNFIVFDWNLAEIKEAFLIELEQRPFCTPLSVNLPEFADACADLKYVIVGSELEFGIDGRPVFAGVHEANLKKIGGGTRADGKFLKPEGWQPFDVAAELRRQGMKP